MAVFPFCSLQTDARGMELAEHGSALFPVSCYDEDLVQTPVAWHWHEDLEILVITEGTARIDTGTERLLLPRGQGLFINAGMLHSIHSSEGGPCALRSLVFHPRLAGGSADSIFWQNYIQPLVQNEGLKYVLLDGSLPWHPEAFQSFWTAWDACARETFGYEFQVRSSLSWLLFLLFSHRPADASPPSATTAEIAASAGISESEALRCFRSTIGMPPVRYLRQYRVERAAALLSSSQYKISEIGSMCGFGDASYFTKLFREQKGCTPTQYRQKNLPDLR